MALTMATKLGFLVNGDCLELYASLADSSVDCVFADPPFNLGKKYGSVEDLRAEDDYRNWLEKWLGESVRVLKPGGSLFVYHIPKWQIEIGSWLMRQPGMEFRNWIAVSMKNCHPRKNRLYPAHYGLLYFTKGCPKSFNADLVRVPLPTCRHCGRELPDWGGYRKKLNPLGTNLTDIWTDTAPVRHRSTKARAFGINEIDPRIPERAILLSTVPGDVVLDPFGGGGTTYRVAERLGRYWLGSELADCSAILESMRGLGSSGEGVCPPPDLLGLFRQAVWRTGTGVPTSLRASGA